MDNRVCRGFAGSRIDQPTPAMRGAIAVCGAAILSVLLSACSGESADDPEGVGAVQQPESRVSTPTECKQKVKVTGVGDVPMEDYLANVLACEIPADAPLEAKKAQAIAARTYTYRYLGDHSSICNSQSCQVYSCSYRPNGPNESDYQAVRETSGQVLASSDDKLIYSFFVAGDPNTSGPSCKGTVKKSAASNGYEKFVTYNEGKSGSDASPSKQGYAGNPDNRGSMSQNGAICLANQGRSAEEILDFYYDNALQTKAINGGDCNGSAYPIHQDCFGQSDETCGSDVCAWNGQGYCCRSVSFTGTQCFSDGECSKGQVCAWNKKEFVCTSPRCDRPPKADAGTDAASSEKPKVDYDDKSPEQDETHKQNDGQLEKALSDPQGLASSCSFTPRGTGTAASATILSALALLLAARRGRRRPIRTPRSRRALAAAALFLGLLPSCSKDEPNSFAPRTCTQISVDSLQRSSTLAVSGRYSPNTQGTEVDFLSLEVFPTGAAALTPGIRDLSKTPNDNYETCEYCVRADEDDKTANRRIYLATSGTVELTSVDSASGASSGKLRNVRLVEVTIDPVSHVSKPVPGGQCLMLSSASWDIPKLEQGDCQGLSDCQACCAQRHEAEAVELGKLARACVCSADACLDDCSSLCSDPAGEPTADCTDCARLMLSGANRCAEEVRTSCAQSAACKPMLDCLVSSGCDYLP